MSVGVLIVRFIVGLLFMGHGAQKLFGSFGGPGIDGAGAWMESLGYRNGRTSAGLAGLTEFFAGALLVLGFFTPFAAAAIIGVMVNAIIAVHAPKGVWNTGGGYEYNLVLIAVCCMLAFGGAGFYSMDYAIGWKMGGTTIGLLAIAVGFISGFAMAASRRKPARSHARADERRRAA